MSYMLDTNVFNKIIDEVITLNDLPSDAPFLATPIQFVEINKTSDKARRLILLEKFHELVVVSLNIKTTLWGYSGWGEGAWDATVCYQPLKDALDARKMKLNNVEDALIAEVALVEGHILITADRILADVFRECLGQVILIPSN